MSTYSNDRLKAFLIQRLAREGFQFPQTTGAEDISTGAMDHSGLYSYVASGPLSQISGFCFVCLPFPPLPNSPSTPSPSPAPSLPAHPPPLSRAGCWHAVADSVEQAAAVVLCVSRAYSDSPYCRSEAECKCCPTALSTLRLLQFPNPICSMPGAARPLPAHSHLLKSTLVVADA